MMNNFQNDNSHISTVFMLRLIRGRGLTIKHLIEVTHIGTNALHIVALLPDISKTRKKLPCGTLQGNACIVPNAKINGIHFIFTISAGEIATILAKLVRIRHFAIVCTSSSFLFALSNVAR